jgi:hypothetical protein
MRGEAMNESEVWAPRTVAEVADRPGTYVRLPARHRGQPIEGAVIRGRTIAASVNGEQRGTGVQLALRTGMGRTEVTLRGDDTLQALVTREEAGLRPESAKVDGRLEAQLAGAAQLQELDSLVARLQDLEIAGSDDVRGYQTPAMRQVIGALVRLREGATNVAGSLG